MERSVARLIADVKQTEATLRREVEELERQCSPSHINAPQAASGGTKTTKSIVKLKAERLEKSKALRLAVQVRRCHTQQSLCYQHTFT